VITTTTQWDVADCTVFLDDTDPLQLYAVPNSPKISTDANGDPVFSLIQYRRPIDQVPEADRATKLGGGILSFAIDLGRTDAQDAQIKQALSQDPQLQTLLATPRTDGVDYSDWWNNQVGHDASQIAAKMKISSLPVESGSVAVSVDAEDGSTPGEFVTTLAGAGTVSMTADERGAFVAKLTMDGSTLLWDALQKNLPGLVWVGYKLNFTARLDGVRMVCWAHTHDFYHALQEQWQDLQEQGSYSDTTDGSSSWHTYDHSQDNSASNALTKIAVQTQTAGVTVTPTSGTIKPDVIAQLTTQGMTLVSNYLASTFLQVNPADFTTKDDPTLKTQLANGGDNRVYGGDDVSQYTVRSVDENTFGDFNLTLDEKATTPWSVNPTATFSDILAGQDVSKHMIQIDLDQQFFHYADVQISCTTDFAKEPVDAIKIHVEYHGTAPSGRIDEVKDFLFNKADSGPKTFSTYIASPDQDHYTYSVEVYYSGSDKTYSFSGTSNDTELVLDTDTLGVVSVDLQIGVVDWSRYKAVQVELSYGGGAPDTFTLTAQKQSDSWVSVVGGNVTGGYEYTLTWTDTTDQQIKGTPTTSTSRRLVIDEPLQQAMSITVVPAGSFGDDGLLSRIVVALRYEDTAHNYEQTATATFTSEKDSFVWTVPLQDTTLRTYQYQVSVFYSDGVTRLDPTWLSSDQAVLAVGDPYGYKVQFIPARLATPPGKWSLGTLHVEFSDPAGDISVQQDFSITDFTKPIFWRFRLADKDRHSYSYQLTLYGPDSSQPPVVEPTVTDTREVVVLAAS
jgi:hypothetical protein